MFNRNNLPSVPNPFGQRPDGSGGHPPPRDGYSNPNQQQQPPYPRNDGRDGRMGGGYGAPPQYNDNDVTMTDGYGDSRAGFGGQHNARPMEKPMPARPGGGGYPPQSRPPVGGGGGGSGGRAWSLRPAKSPDNSYTYGNLYASSSRNFLRYPVYYQLDAHIF